MEDTITIKREKYSQLIYIPGTEPEFEVGDVLAVYDFSTDHEGEIILGQVVNVEFSEENCDWFYTLEDKCIYSGEGLNQDEAYVKQRSKKEV